MTMFISSITDISSFSDPKVYFLLAPLQRKILKQILKSVGQFFKCAWDFLSIVWERVIVYFKNAT